MAKTPSVSASQLKTFWPGYGGCQRKWGFEKIDNLPRPQSDAAKLGTDVHTCLENFVLRGQVFPANRPGKTAHTALDYAKEAMNKPGLEVEGRKDPSQPAKRFRYVEDGVPYIGYVDVRWLHPVGFPVVRDWKTSSNPKRYGLTHDTMLDDPQVIVYGRQELARHGPEVDTIMFDWVYMNTKRYDPAYSVRVQTSRAEIDARWPAVHAVGKQIVEAKLTTKRANDLPPNFDACDAFGGCPFKDRCQGAYDIQNILGDFSEVETLPRTKEQNAMPLDPSTLLANRRARQGRKPPVDVRGGQGTPVQQPEPAPEPKPAPETIAEAGPVETIGAGEKRPGLDPAAALAKYDTPAATERAQTINAPESGLQDEEIQREVSRLNAIVIEANPGKGKAKEARENYAQAVSEAIAQGKTPAEADALGKKAADLNDDGTRKNARRSTKKKAAAAAAAAEAAAAAAGVHPSDAWLRIFAVAQDVAETDAAYKHWLATFAE